MRFVHFSFYLLKQLLQWFAEGFALTLVAVFIMLCIPFAWVADHWDRFNEQRLSK